MIERINVAPYGLQNHIKKSVHCRIKSECTIFFALSDGFGSDYFILFNTIFYSFVSAMCRSSITNYF